MLCMQTEGLSQAISKERRKELNSIFKAKGLPELTDFSSLDLSTHEGAPGCVYLVGEETKTELPGLDVT